MRVGGGRQRLSKIIKERSGERRDEQCGRHSAKGLRRKESGLWNVSSRCLSKDLHTGGLDCELWSNPHIDLRDSHAAPHIRNHTELTGDKQLVTKAMSRHQS